MPKIENTTGMPVNLIIDELKSEDIRKRIHSVKNLNLIASTIGPDRTKNELIPFLQGKKSKIYFFKLLQDLLDDEDEVLLELVDSLSNNFVEFVGGNPLVLMPTFEALCKVEDSNVRDKAAAQIKKGLQTVTDQKKYEELALGIIKRLNENDYYMSKSALTQILPVVYGNVSAAQQQILLDIYNKLTQDPIPSVRKYSSINFQVFCFSYYFQKKKDLVKYNLNDNYLNQILNSQIKDEQDFIRMFVVDSAVALVKTNKGQNLAIQLFKQLAEDISWRVRYYFCEKLGDIADSLGKDAYKKNFQAYHLKFLQDPEPEMKTVATQKIEKVSQTMDVDDILKQLIPILKIIQTDTNAFVRNALASSILTLCPILGKKNTSESILPIFLNLLKDTDSEVRITLFKKLSLITNVLGVDALSQSVIPALTELAQDKNWRIRASTIEVLAFFAKAIGPEFLSEKVVKLLLDWMGDKVFSVRSAAITSTQQLIQILGPQWAERNLLTRVWQFQQIQNYLHRQTVLFTINAISSLMQQDYLTKTILPILQQMSKDSVANIRINVCKSIQSTFQFHKEKDQLKKILSSLSDDQDQEVKYQAKTSLESLT